MVRVTFKLSDVGTVELPVEEEQTLADVLRGWSEISGINIGGYIAVRRGMVIAPTTMVEEHDQIDIYPALSGG